MKRDRLKYLSLFVAETPQEKLKQADELKSSSEEKDAEIARLKKLLAEQNK
ncbi:MAG: hypothetical protein Q4E78_09225 [Eubacteriales bacterium]|nr:hypothetical protein [Eubacteriales bacterium]